MNTIPTIDWTDLATHDDLALIRSDIDRKFVDFDGKLIAMENRLQRSLVTWILAAQGVTLATMSVLVTVLT